MADSATGAGTTDSSRVTLALGLAGAALVLFFVAMAVAGGEDETYGFLWPLAGLTGLGAAIVGWRAGRPRPQGRALLAVAAGGLVFLAILGWIVVAAISGDL